MSSIISISIFGGVKKPGGKRQDLRWLLGFLCHWLVCLNVKLCNQMVRRISQSYVLI